MYTCICVYLYIHIINIHSTHTHIMYTKTFILDVINRCPALIKLIQLHLHIYSMCLKNILELYFWYTKLLYLKSAKLVQLL